MGSASPLHVVVIPYLAQGHTVPLIDLSKLLARRGIKVTIITTPANSQNILSRVSRTPEISLSIIPFPRVEGLPEGVENTADIPSVDLFLPFIVATKKLKEPFENILRDMFKAGCPPICIISDFFLSWTIDTCRSFNIPRVVSHGMGVLPQVISKAAFSHAPQILASLPSDVIQFPELTIPFQLHRADFFDFHRYTNPNDPLSKVVMEAGKADMESWGVVVNSFEELESEDIAALESFYGNDAKAWCVGPLLLCDQIEDDEGANEPKKENQTSYPYIEWLDKQDGPDTVLYVSFGTQARLSNMQMDEIALGLEMAMHPFIWVVKSQTWLAPEGWEERVKRRGLIVRTWVEQRRILAHPKVGGFLSHCGWNSVLESLSMGVPMLAWPMGAEQPFNAKVAERLGAGMRILEVVGEGTGTIGSEIICDKVKELMCGAEGRKARERAQELKRMTRQAVKKGGSSDRTLNELIECLAHRRTDM
ncbi:hypothetical protein AAG906_039523 [Vitis piasezkii]